MEIAVCQLSAFEFHPVFISPAPQEDIIRLHIHGRGGWSNKLGNFVLFLSPLCTSWRHCYTSYLPLGWLVQQRTGQAHRKGQTRSQYLARRSTWISLGWWLGQFFVDTDTLCCWYASAWPIVFPWARCCSIKPKWEGRQLALVRSAVRDLVRNMLWLKDGMVKKTGRAQESDRESIAVACNLFQKTRCQAIVKQNREVILIYGNLNIAHVFVQ